MELLLCLLPSLQLLALARPQHPAAVCRSASAPVPVCAGHAASEFGLGRPVTLAACVSASPPVARNLTRSRRATKTQTTSSCHSRSARARFTCHCAFLSRAASVRSAAESPSMGRPPPAPHSAFSRRLPASPPQQQWRERHRSVTNLAVHFLLNPSAHSAPPAHHRRPPLAGDEREPQISNDAYADSTSDLDFRFGTQHTRALTRPCHAAIYADTGAFTQLTTSPSPKHAGAAQCSLLSPFLVVWMLTF